MKTIEEWLSEIPDDEIRRKAIAYSKKYKSNVSLFGLEAPDLHDAIFIAFLWEETEEGAMYWFDYCKSLKQKI